MVAAVATTGVAATAATAGEAAAGVAVPAKTGNEALVEVEGEPDSTGGLISRFLGGIDEGTAAGAWTGVEVDAAALAAGALSAGAIAAGDATGVGVGTAAG